VPMIRVAKTASPTANTFLILSPFRPQRRRRPNLDV